MIVTRPFRYYKPAAWHRGGRYRARLDHVWAAAERWALEQGHRVDNTYGIVTKDGEAFAPL